MSRFVGAVGTLVACFALTPAAAANDETAAAHQTRLAAERLQFKADLAKKQKQIDALVALLNENGIGVPTEIAGPPPSAGAAAGSSSASNPKGAWIVRVVTNQEVSTEDARQRAASGRRRVADVDQQLDDAKRRYASMQDSFRYYSDRRHSNAELGQARAEVARLDAERRRAVQQIAQAERQLQDAGKDRIVVGHLDDGTAVNFRAANEAAAALVRGLEVGESYRVTGVGSMKAGALSLKMHSAVRLSTPTAEPPPARPATPTRRGLVPAPAARTQEGGDASPKYGRLRDDELPGGTSIFQQCPD